VAIEVVSYETPVVRGHERLVRAKVAFDLGYVDGGEILTPLDFGISEITDVDDAWGEGFLLRFFDQPPRLKFYGIDTDTGLMAEIEQGHDHSYVDDVRINVWGW
jgi:hypothetical protein